MTDFSVLRRTLERRSPRLLVEGERGLRPAAVLVPLFVKAGAAHLLLTRRTDLMRHHRGEIAFPGGVRQAEDDGLLQTALRETEEEIGIAAAEVEVIGRLDDIASVHGYRVTPFVGTFPAPCSYRLNPGEIAEVLEVPLADLRDSSRWRVEDWRHRGRIHPVHFFDLGEHDLWGMTAAIVRQLLRCLAAD